MDAAINSAAICSETHSPAARPILGCVGQELSTVYNCELFDALGWGAKEHAVRRRHKLTNCGIILLGHSLEVTVGFTIDATEITSYFAEMASVACEETAAN